MKLYIGIDPGVKTGIAIWRTSPPALLDVATADFFGTCRMLSKVIDPTRKTNVTVVIEDPNLIEGVYRQRVAAVIKSRQFHQMQTLLKIAQNVGMNKRDAQLLIQYCESLGFRVIKVKPTNTKRTAKEFKQLTKYSVTTSQHARDAAMLVFGRT